jgi:hypothetical protein
MITEESSERTPAEFMVFAGALVNSDFMFLLESTF